MDMRSSVLDGMRGVKRRRSREDGARLSEEMNLNCVARDRASLSDTSPEILSSGLSLPSFPDDVYRPRSSSSRASVSPAPLSVSSSRRNSASVIDSSNNNHKDNGSFPSATASSRVKANPQTKNVGVSVNLGKGNVKQNGLSPAGAQHVIPNGQQQQQQPGATMLTTDLITNTSSSRKDNGNCAAINLGHGHIGTIAGPSSVSISSNGLPSPVPDFGHNSSSPAENAPTTCANKGVSSSSTNNNLSNVKHLSSSSPQPQMSPACSTTPINHVGAEPPPQTESATELAKSSNSSLSSSGTDSTSGSDGGKHGEGSCTRPSSPTPSTSSTTSSRGSKGEKQGSKGKKESKNESSKDRIVSQNVNGTLAVTGVPSNDSELQLFRVLQRANLLSYFDLMIELGGDDVQQLCDAGNEEFLEIMSLIGMASKPLHVRRLQKALQEWMTQPSLFQSPVLPPGYPGNGSQQALQGFPPHLPVAATAPGMQIPHLPTYPQPTVVPVSSEAVPVLYPGATSLIPTPSNETKRKGNQIKSNGIHFPSESSLETPNPFSAAFAIQQAAALNVEGYSSQLAAMLGNLNPISNLEKDKSTPASPFSEIGADLKIPADQIIPSHFLETRIRTRSEASSPRSSFAGSPHPDLRNSASPAENSLNENEVQKLAEAAFHLVRSLPPTVHQPKFSSKRKTSGDYELILRLSDGDPRRMDEVRRVAAVYGRAEAKRKSAKPLSMHELAINEAAAQLCKQVPALLTKREELLSLARLVLRESGLPYAAVSSTFSISILTNNNNNNTKSKYDELNGHSNGAGHSLSNLRRERNVSSSSSEGNNVFGGFTNPAKRLRLDGASAGIEIQEYSNGRPLHPLQQSSPSPPTSTGGNGMQITELRCLPPKRSSSPSADHLPSPLELVTVTTAELRKNGINGSKSAPSAPDSYSPPIRRPVSLEAFEEAQTSKNLFHPLFPQRINQQGLDGLPSVKITSIPVSGGSISISNHNGLNGHAHNYPHHHRLLHHQYSGSVHGSGGLPIKSEPTVN